VPALERQTVLVTGAAQGLGAAIARDLARRGAALILMDYNRAGLERIAAKCDGSPLAIAVDLSDAADTDRAIASALGANGRVDTLVHNAAILEPKPFAELDLREFNRTLNVGLQAGFQLARAVWPGMVAAGGGTLIFVSSRSGIEGFANETAYCAAKHALEGLSKCLAIEGKPHGIASVTITPGMYMHTPMSERTYSAELRSKWVEPDRLAPAFAKLASGAGHLSGQRLDAWQLSQS
jgi:NAD(P)-dependent dehydrogenase (short-subunit alcohol dehydrogenase family)